MSSVLAGPVLVVAGARPNFMKVVPILHELDRRGISRRFVHTGQHYDVRMSATLLSDLGAPAPDELLDVGSGTHAVQTARVMERIEPVLRTHRPSWVVVVGDVNSTLACALVAVKLREELGCRVAHVEAGLRSGDWSMPEEINRVLTDRLSDLLLSPSRDVGPNLEREGLLEIPHVFVGNVMIDSLLAQLPAARALALPTRLGLPMHGYVLATLHRPSNVDDPARLPILLDALRGVARTMPVLFPMHPRTRARVAALDVAGALDGLTVVEPLGYREMLSAMDGARACVTDSGGVQEESTVLGVPCLTVRAQTERPITVTEGTNRMASWPPTADGVRREIEETLARERLKVGDRAPEGWDGRTAARIVDALLATPHPAERA